MQTQYNRDELLACAQGELFGEGNAKLPAPDMLMMDRILTITEDGGQFTTEASRQAASAVATATSPSSACDRPLDGCDANGCDPHTAAMAEDPSGSITFRQT